MAAQAGRSLIFKFDNAAGATIAAAISNSFTINGQAVNVTTKDSAAYRDLLAGAGNAFMSLQISGRASDSAHLSTLASRAGLQSVDAYYVVFGNGDNITVNAQITNFTTAGDNGDAQTFSAALESSGQWTLAVV